jgi:hypothetical protein
MYPLGYRYRDTPVDVKSTWIILNILRQEDIIYVKLWKICIYLIIRILYDHERLYAWSYMDLIVCLDIRNQWLRFFVRFFVWSDMIMSDIGVWSGMIISESEMDLIVRFLDLGNFVQSGLMKIN